MLESRPKSYTQEISTETKLKETFPNVHTCRFYTMSLIKTNTQIQTHTHSQYGPFQIKVYKSILLINARYTTRRNIFFKIHNFAAILGQDYCKN